MKASGFAATLCCLGPLVFTALGLGDFATAGFFHELRPFCLGVAFLLVAAAWDWNWRKRKQVASGFFAPQRWRREDQLEGSGHQS